MKVIARLAPVALWLQKSDNVHRSREGGVGINNADITVNYERVNGRESGLCIQATVSYLKTMHE